MAARRAAERALEKPDALCERSGRVYALLERVAVGWPGGAIVRASQALELRPRRARSHRL